jgi:hypothetical protein
MATFFNGQSWIDVLNTPPKGDPYIILARQFIAASLNILCLENYVGVSALSSMETLAASYEIRTITDHAETLLTNSYDSPLLEKYSSDSTELELLKSVVRQDFITTAYFLDQFNNSFGIPEED